MSDRMKLYPESVASAKVIYPAIAVILLLAMLKMPYGYYTFARIAVCGLSGWLCYKNWGTVRNMNNIWFWIFGIVAILFNPIIPVHLDREIWIWIDLLCVCIFIGLSFQVYFGKTK